MASLARPSVWNEEWESHDGYVRTCYCVNIHSSVGIEALGKFWSASTCFLAVISLQGVANSRGDRWGLQGWPLGIWPAPVQQRQALLSEFQEISWVPERQLSWCWPWEDRQCCWSLDRLQPV